MKYYFFFSFLFLSCMPNGKVKDYVAQQKVEDYIGRMLYSKGSLDRYLCSAVHSLENDYCHAQINGVLPSVFFNNGLDDFFSNYSIER